MSIYSFSPFGYEGSLVQVEVDLRRGIPAVDFVGLSDGCVKESRERVRCAIKNSGFEFPSERVLISLSPADLKKEGAGFDLPIALGILDADNEERLSESVMVMGELELSGKVRSVKGIIAGLKNAITYGIKYAIIPHSEDLEIPKGIKVCKVETLEQAYLALHNILMKSNEGFYENTTNDDTTFKVEFAEIGEEESTLDDVKGLNNVKYAMAVAVAGKHNLIVTGEHGCGKTLALQKMPQLMPKLTADEFGTVNRIYSLTGLSQTEVIQKHIRPFRMPHQTASIEGMCGGGANCRAGEITLAHNGVLFLDESAEFRSSVLQMLRVPLETKTITLSRAGRSTTFPANFQLVMATAPCPCGNFGSKTKICLCSARSVEQFWHKFSAPLMDRIALRINCNDADAQESFTLQELRDMVSVAWERQYKRQGKLNEELNVEEVNRFIHLTDNAQIYLNTVAQAHELSERAVAQIMKVARTLADIHDTKEFETVDKVYVKIAVDLRKPINY